MQKTIREWECCRLHCLITSPDVGPLRGYVGVPEGHPLYGMNLEEEEVKNLAVRDDPEDYGVSFAGDLPADSYAESHGLWWFGFQAQDAASVDRLKQTADECDWLAQELAGIAIIDEMSQGEPAPQSLCTLCGGPADGTEMLIEDGMDVVAVPFDSPAGYPTMASYFRSDEEPDRFDYNETLRPSQGFLF